MPEQPWLALVESNTTGSGREFCAAARSRGLRPVLLASDPGRYPYVAIDRVEHIVTDTRDQAEVLRTCRQLDAVGVAGVTSSSEFFISTAASAAVALGLPAPDPRAVAECRDKHLQRRALEGAGVAVPRSRLAANVAQAVDAARALGLPAVVKPTTGSGSLGVRLCATLQEVADSVAGLLSAPVDPRVASPAPAALVEEYVGGVEFSVETMGAGVVAVVRKHLGPEPFFVEAGHDLPADVGSGQRELLAETALRALAALGLGWGPAHTELRLGESGPVVIEVNPRLAGGMIPAVVRAATGIDLVDCVVAAATGHHVPSAPTRAAAAAIRFLMAPQPGRVVAVDGVEEAARIPSVQTVSVSVGEGDVVPEFSHSFRDRIGYAIAAAPEVAEAARAAEAAVARMTVRVEPRSSTGPGGPGTTSARSGPR